MKEFKFIAIKEEEVVIEQFIYLESCTNLLEALAKREKIFREEYGITNCKRIYITNGDGMILREWEYKNS